MTNAPITDIYADDAAANGPAEAGPPVGARADDARRAERRDARPLDSLPYGVQARVVSVGGEGTLARRLMEMGVVPGAPVCVIKSAPLGDPIEVRVRAYHLALRRSEAHAILVTEEES